MCRGLGVQVPAKNGGVPVGTSSIFAGALSPSARCRSPPKDVHPGSLQLLGLHRELHGELREDLLAEAVDDHGHGVLGVQAALVAVEDLVLTDLRGGRLVLQLTRRGIADLDVGKGVGAARSPISRSRTGEVARIPGVLGHLDQTAVGVLAAAGGDALGDDPAADVFLPRWIILVPVSACWRPLVMATE
jgi:hypothetical protein